MGVDIVQPGTVAISVSSAIAALLTDSPNGFKDRSRSFDDSGLGSRLWIGCCPVPVR